MLSLKRHAWNMLAAFVILAPISASAQPVATSFDQLRRVLKNGQTVIVVDASGRRTQGKVGDVSPSSSLVVLFPGARSLAEGGRSFAEGTLSEIRRTDDSRNGALIGLGVGVGTGIALGNAMCADGPDCGPLVQVGVLTAGIGAAIGAGIDALVNKGGKVVYRSPRHTPGLTLSPLLGNGWHGVLVSLRFGRQP